VANRLYPQWERLLSVLKLVNIQHSQGESIIETSQYLTDNKILPSAAKRSRLGSMPSTESYRLRSMMSKLAIRLRLILSDYPIPVSM
jgi:hypothetical protein